MFIFLQVSHAIEVTKSFALFSHNVSENALFETNFDASVSTFAKQTFLDRKRARPGETLHSFSRVLMIQNDINYRFSTLTRSAKKECKKWLRRNWGDC